MVPDDWQERLEINVEASRDIYNELSLVFQDIKKGELIYYRKSDDKGKIQDVLQRYSHMSNINYKLGILEIWGDSAHLQMVNCMGVQVPTIKSNDHYNLRFGEGDVLHDYAMGKRNIKRALKGRSLDSFLGFVDKVSKVEELKL